MKTLLIAALAVTLAACAGTTDGSTTFKRGLPSASSVRMEVPGSASSSQPLTNGTTKSKLEGKQAEWYVSTRQISSDVNGTTFAVLSLVGNITKYPPTTLSATSAVWGPHTEALSPNTWKLSVVETGIDQYTYALEGRAKTEPDSAFRVILSGVHSATSDDFGYGSFMVDFDKAQELPEHDANVGALVVEYDHRSASADVTINATFSKVKDNKTSQLADGTYSYSSRATGGSLDFSMEQNLFGGAGIETLTLRSRWENSGAGRADAKVSGGDLGQTAANVSECWDAGFLSRVFMASYDPSLNYGAESSCAFTSAEYSTQ